MLKSNQSQDFATEKLVAVNEEIILRLPLTGSPPLSSTLQGLKIALDVRTKYRRVRMDR